MILLSQHFLLDEFVRSDVATRKGIDNDPPADVLENLKLLAEALERVRAFLDRPLLVSSGYRCEELERDLTTKGFAAWCAKRGLSANDESWNKYFSAKFHPKGLAADWTCPGFGTPSKVVAALAANRKLFTFDQIILEFPNAPNGGWVHYGIAAPGDTPRGEILTYSGGHYERYTA